MIGQLAGGNEGAYAADVAQQAALDGFLAFGFHVLAVFVLGYDLVPQLTVDDVLLAEQHVVAVAVVELHNLGLYLVAHLDIAITQIVSLDLTVHLVAGQLYVHTLIGDLQHLHGHDLTGTILL